MKKLKELIKQYRKSINPPYSRKDYPVIGTTLLVLLIAVALIINIPNRYKTQQTTPSHAQEGQLNDIVISNPQVRGDLWPYDSQSKGKMSDYGTLSVLMYQDINNHAPWMYFIDSLTGATSHVKVPDYISPSNEGTVNYVLTSPDELWVFAGAGGAAEAWQYHLDGSPLPTTATVVSKQILGDSNSYADGILKLKSGGLVATAVQHNNGNLLIAYRSPTGIWSTTIQDRSSPAAVDPSTAGWSMVDHRAMAQHPADDSIWIFNDFDSTYRIGVTHLTEGPTGLKIDWWDQNFITQSDGVGNAPDPEHPQIVAAADPTRNAIQLAYESDNRQMISVSPLVTVSYPAIAQIKADKTKSFLPYPVWVERVEQFGFVVTPDKFWIFYRPVDATTFACSKIYLNSYTVSTGVWDTPQYVATIKDIPNPNQPCEGYAPYDWRGYGVSRPEFALLTIDNKLHYYTFPVASPTPTNIPTTPTPVPPTPTPFPTATPKPSPTIAPADTQPPSVSITQPTNGATVPVGKKIVITATASDNIKVAKVEFYVNGVRKCSDNSSPYVCAYNVPSTVGVSYTITAKAYDSVGNISSRSITVTGGSDVTKPIVSLTNPVSGSTVSHSTKVTMTATASDEVGVSKVEFYVNGSRKCSDTATPYSCNWSVGSAIGTSYTLEARAYDPSNNISSSFATVTSQ